MTDINNREDILDSRDVIERIAELEADLEGITLNDDTSQYERAGADYSAEWEELEALKALEAEAEPYAPDWEHGCTLIRDSYFQDYAEELADDIGAVSKNATWPNNFIDWEAAAEALKADYTSVEFDGVTYWVR